MKLTLPYEYPEFELVLRDEIKRAWNKAHGFVAEDPSEDPRLEIFLKELGVGDEEVHN